MSEFVVLLERLIGWAELWGMGTDSHSAEKLADTRAALVEYVARLEAEVERLREAARWIPVSERLPEREEGGRFSIDVSVVTVGRRVTKAYCNIENRRWIDPETEEYIDITHWRPLPEPPEAE